LVGCFVKEIELAIRPGNVQGIFRVEVTQSPAGEATAAVALDVDALLARRVQLQQAVLASAVASRAVLTETERPVREVGLALFSALLGSDEVAGRYRASTALSDQQDQALRISLRIYDPALAGLPWEAMYDEGLDFLRDQLACSRRSPTRRYERQPDRQTGRAAPYRTG
jgi:hypothetical protein